MGMSYEGSESLLQRTQNFVDVHRELYLSTKGLKGHLMDLSHAGSPGLTPTLLLKNVGRKSGVVHIAPLIYGIYGREWVVIGSKGGAPDHPAWYLNLREQKAVEFQVAGQAMRGTWREAQGEERKAVWAYMCGVYPPYVDYEEGAGDRQIPVILMKPEEEIANFGGDLA
jgi:deazaflavin-dependent oxidoreductase (nitroreductase family)